MEKSQPRKTRSHVVISGTGRTGTTFLVQLLTRIGLDTGFSEENMKLHEHARAGLESDVRKDNAAYIVKSPYFCEYAPEVLGRDDIVIEHVIIPMRDLHAAAESRRFVLKNTLAGMPLLKRLRSQVRPPTVPGGLFNTRRRSKQEKVLLEELYNLLLVLSPAHIPVTLVEYPKLVKEPEYLYQKLQFLLAKTSYDQFLVAFKKTVRPEWVHTFDGSRQ